MATIYDIAKAADTSPGTVSRVINGRHGVKAETAQRIRQAIENLDFRPRWAATDRNRFLVFTPQYKHAFDSGYIARVMSGICDAAYSIGFGLQLRPSFRQERDISELKQLFLQEAVSGCIIISYHQTYSLPAQLDLAGLPHVVVGHKLQDDNIHQVLIDDYEAGVNAANYLLSLGHKQIAMISFSHRSYSHHNRYRGFADAMAKAGLSDKPTCLECDSTVDAGKSAARNLLSTRERPSAVIITNEDIAAGFQLETKIMGFSIPKDISILAFEETDKLSLLDTPISAMQTPAYNSGVEAVNMLRGIIQNDASTSKKGAIDYQSVHIPIPFIARLSTAMLVS